MSKIFITGSSDGLGLLSAQALASRGHRVYLHARNAKRADDARRGCPQATGCLVGDLSSASETKSLAQKLNEEGPWDAIIHNAGIMSGGGRSALFNINTMAPYLLTCLVEPPPKRYVFLSSSMHQGGDGSLSNIEQCRYSDSKLHNIMLAFWFAKKFGAGVASNSMDPGWVPTKMGGSGAPDDIDAAVDTYVMLAEGKGAAEGQTGKYWYQKREKSCKSDASDEKKQDHLIQLLQEISGVSPPR
ncbi:short chain dehydrogenase [Pestalotiopsis sp. NC0098]|nr:short chain dehydrogenase [Pestalotiopsis sp. NC0098]